MARTNCYLCRSAPENCYCKDLRPFNSIPEFCFLMYPKEAKRKLATGRMAHRMLRNSHLIVGERFDHSAKLKNLLNNKSYEPYLLYPSSISVEVSKESPFLSRNSARTPLIIILDGTWNWAKLMYRNSPILHDLPALHIRPNRPSIYGFKRQPRIDYLSTLESVQFILKYCDGGSAHRDLLAPFRQMIERQRGYSIKRRNS